MLNYILQVANNKSENTFMSMIVYLWADQIRVAKLRAALVIRLEELQLHSGLSVLEWWRSGRKPLFDRLVTGIGDRRDGGRRKVCIAWDCGEVNSSWCGHCSDRQQGSTILPGQVRVWVINYEPVTPIEVSHCPALKGKLGNLQAWTTPFQLTKPFQSSE